MATPDQITQLRRMVGETSNTDEQLANLIDSAGGDLSEAAAHVWEQKAAELATYVDVKEGASSRQLGSLHQNAIEMARFYQTNTQVAGAARTRPAAREGGI